MGNSNGHLSDRRKNRGPDSSHIEGPLDITTTTTNTQPVSTKHSNVSGLGFRPRSSTTDSTKRKNVFVPNILENGSLRKLPTIFKYGGDAKDVFISGSFNGWKKLRMIRSSKDFVAIVDLTEGDHEYIFEVDGNMRKDEFSRVDSLSKNNVIHVQKEDFDAFEALDMDSAAVLHLQQNKQFFKNEFSQDIPNSYTFERRSGPPILPPHLLQVILNKDTPLFCEPTLLPEPNHVMLNHLYALSIKEGVMVLSSTQRYRKKYVTTLLYTPMSYRKIV